MNLFYLKKNIILDYYSKYINYNNKKKIIIRKYKNNNILFNILIKILILLIVLNFNFILSQNVKKKIKIIRSQLIEKTTKLFEKHFFLIGKIKLEYDQKYKIYADTILINESNNTLQAFSNIKIIIKNPNISFSCEKFEYNANNKTIIAEGNVTFKDQNQIIHTEKLIYNKIKNQGYFTNGGCIKILNQKLETKKFFFNNKNNEGYFTNGGCITDLSTGNIIKSKSGLIVIPQKLYTFYDSVIIHNPQYIINSKKILINQISKRINFLGPTTIKNNKNLSNYIYTEKGYLCNNFFFLNKKSKIYYNKKIIKGKYILYNNTKKYTKIYGNFYFKDQNKYNILKGGKAEFFQLKDSIIITKKPYGIQHTQQKKLYFSADTLIINQKENEKYIKKYIIYGFKNVRFFEFNIQGICDSIKINEINGTLEFYKNPIIWIKKNQITSNKIVAYLNLKNKNIDSIYFNNDAFLINKLNFMSKKEFNQIKSKKIIIYLKKNKIFKIVSLGNSESIIHLYKKNKKIKINKTKCNISIIKINKNAIQNILYKMYIKSQLYSTKKIPKHGWYLKDFKWRKKDRLIKCNDIFLKNKLNIKSNFNKKN